MQITTSRYAGLALAVAVGTTLGACSGRRSSPAVPESAGGNVSAPAPPDSTTTGAAGGAVTGSSASAAPGAAPGVAGGATTGAAAGTDTTGGNAARSDTGAVTGAAGGEVASAASAFKGLSDANYSALVSQANKGEVQAGKLMETKASNPRVKAFARRMVKDHTALEQQAHQLVQKLNLTPQPPANDPVEQMHSSTMHDLQSMNKGPTLDSAYIDQQVKAHKAVLDLLSAIEGDANNAQLKALAKKAQPVIESHLRAAESIQQQLKSGAKPGK